MALTDWGYKRRRATRTSSTYTPGTRPGGWSSASYSAQEGESKPESAMIGPHNLSQSSSYTGDRTPSGELLYRDTQTVTYDTVYLVFDKPSATDAILRVYVDANMADTITAKRITAAVPSGTSLPSTTSTHAASAAVPKGGGWAELDISEMVADADTWYGVTLDSSTVFDSRKNNITFSQIELPGGSGAAIGKVMVNGAPQAVKAALVKTVSGWVPVKSKKVKTGGTWN